MKKAMQSLAVYRDIEISDIIVEGQTKTLIIETPPVAHYCSTCGYHMHSRVVKNTIPKAFGLRLEV